MGNLTVQRNCNEFNKIYQSTYNFAMILGSACRSQCSKGHSEIPKGNSFSSLDCPGDRVLASRVSGCLLDSLGHERYLILGKKTPYILVCVFPKY